MIVTEAFFFPHCDTENCDLGTFHYTCPKCNNTIEDYDLWWKENDIYMGKLESFNCEKCNEQLTVEWFKHDNTYIVY